MSRHPSRVTIPRDPQQKLDDFFDHWIYRQKVVATVEGAFHFEEARRAWEATRETTKWYRIRSEDLAKDLRICRAMHKQYVQDHTQIFICRPRLRKLVRLLVKLQ